MAITSVLCETDFLRLSVSDGKEATQDVQYPYIWLRDNCQCAECFDAKSYDRKLSPGKIDPNIQAKSAKVRTPDQVEVTWPGDHCSVFNLSWLFHRSFDGRAWAEHDLSRDLKYRMWCADEMRDKIPTVQYNQLMTDDKILLKWLSNLEILGVCLVQGTPAKLGVVQTIGQHIAPLKHCHYGEASEVQANLTSSNLAYNTATLGFHTDFPSLENAPDMQMLHCIKQASGDGGDTMLVDAFHVAQDLRKENEAMFNALRDTLVDFKDFGTFEGYQFKTRTKRSIFECNAEGELVRIFYSNTHRDSMLKLPLQDIKFFYQALITFENMLNDEKYCVLHKLQPGEMMCFNNLRVMHGRLGFTEANSGERHLQVAYIDWDYLKSKRRVLQENLNFTGQKVEELL